jgi:hypothetical protein
MATAAQAQRWRQYGSSAVTVASHRRRQRHLSSREQWGGRESGRRLHLRALTTTITQNANTTKPLRCHKVKGSWGRRLLAVAGEVTRHGRAHPYSWLITIVILRSKESEESHRSEWKTKLLGMFLAVTCQHASGACQSHSRLVQNLREALQKYVELSPSTPPFLTLLFYKKDLTLTPNLLRISGRYSLRLGIFDTPKRSFQSPQRHSGDWVSWMIL